MNAEVDFTKLSPESLDAIVSDEAWPPAMRSAAKAEQADRSGGDSPLAKAMAKRSAAAEPVTASKGGPATSPGNGGIEASHAAAGARNHLARAQARRASRAAE